MLCGKQEGVFNFLDVYALYLEVHRELHYYELMTKEKEI